MSEEKKKTWVAMSRDEWLNADQRATTDVIRTGSTQRIASALESIAKSLELLTASHRALDESRLDAEISRDAWRIGGKRRDDQIKSMRSKIKKLEAKLKQSKSQPQPLNPTE